MLDNTLEKRAVETEQRLEDLRIAEVREVEDVAAHPTREFLAPEDLEDEAFEPCSVGYTWERGREASADDRRKADADVVTGDVSSDLELGRNVWFRLRFTVPDSMAGHPVYLRFVARPRGGDAGHRTPRVESLCFRDGVPWKAFDNGHDSLKLVDDADGGETFELLVEAGTTTLWGKLDVEAFELQTAELYAERPEVAEFHRHFQVCHDLVDEFDEESPNWGTLLTALSEASHEFPFEADAEAALRNGAQEGIERLEAVESELSSDISGERLTAVGHAHLDLAWLWPWSETVRKCGRSFSNVLRLMEEYDEFTFTQSQPHLYEWVRNRYPEQFEAITDRVDEGRWHPEGALWVESDINNVGSEALARQFLLGTRYFREEFGVDPSVTFLPDVFGYSAGLPGVAAAADCPYLLTQKMSWSETNEFPHNTFWWEGIDGSSVLAHFPPVDTYNGMVDVEEVTKSVYNDSQNHVADDRAYLVGYGDGGGGPTREMVETADVMDDVEALPDVEWGSLEGMFERLEEDGAEYPDWAGELYLEKHRATLTTQAETKRNNRKGEYALVEAELWSALARARAGTTYPHDALTEAWQTLLFNQFHDILPGSSVTDVYADADRDYQRVFDTAESVRSEALAALLEPTSGGERVCVTNPLSWTWSPTVAVTDGADAWDGDELVARPDDGADEALAVQRTTAGIGDPGSRGDDALLVEGPSVPGLGASSVSIDAAPDEGVENPFEVSTDHVSNGLVTVSFDDGTIDVTDEVAERPVLDGPGNRLMLYRDHPKEHDAWDVEEDLYAVGEELPAPETEVLESGPVRATVRQTRSFGDSELVQDVTLYRDSRRIDFRTSVDWQEEERFLKTHFPAGVSATRASYDTHFGHHERTTHDNTTWDQAQYEEAGGEWVDVSAPDYGVAVLNDCKYGVDVDRTDVSLSLLRAPNQPDPEADRGSHQFTYSLYPHEGDHVDAGVERAAKELNAPVRTVPVSEPVSLAPITIDADSVIVEAVKRSEDREDELVLRLYEADGCRSTATLSFDFPVDRVEATNLVEDAERTLTPADGAYELSFDAFEIKTIAVELDE